MHARRVNPTGAPAWPARLRPLATLALLSALAALTALALLPASRAGAATPFCEKLRAELAAGAGSGGLMVRDLGSDRTLCSAAARHRRILASNTKLFTTAAVLARLRPATKLATTVWRVGEVSDRGILRGDLYLRGGGDPALAMPAYAARHRPRVTTNLLRLRARIRRAGIKGVAGRLYADDTIFDRLRGVPDSGWGLSPYVGPLSGLALNSGFTAPGRKYFASDPALLAAEKLARSLQAAGIRVGGGIGLGGLPRARGRWEPVRIGAVGSPPISLLAEQTNVHSDNFFAETLLKLLGARTVGSGTTRAGAWAARRVARALGTDAELVDGSGLSRGNRASPLEVVELLSALSRRPLGRVFRGTLPLTGRDGTVAGRTRGTPAERRCEVKTGTLTGVSALSGYCSSRSGREIAFSILMTSVSSSTAARNHQDRIVARLAGI